MEIRVASERTRYLPFIKISKIFLILRFQYVAGRLNLLTKMVVAPVRRWSYTSFRTGPPPLRGSYQWTRSIRPTFACSAPSASTAEAASCTDATLTAGTCRSASVPVPVPVLGALIARPGNLVPRDEIMRAAWPGTVVEEGNLAVQISALRHILDAGSTGESCLRRIWERIPVCPFRD